MHRSSAGVALALLSSLLFLVSSPAFAAGDPKVVEECARKNLPGDSSVQTLAIQTKDGSGAIKDMKGTIWWKKDAAGLSRVRVLVSEPPDMRGSGVLLVQQSERTDLFVYLPEMKKVRRVTGRMMSGSLFGTDITYEQLERIQGVARDTGAERLDDDVIDGHPVYVLQSAPLVVEESEFSRVVSFIDKQTCLPLKVEFLGGDAQVRRVLEIDPAKIVPQGKGFVPTHITLKDLPSKTETVLVVEKIELDAPIPDKDFSQGALESVGR